MLADEAVVADPVPERLRGERLRTFLWALVAGAIAFAIVAVEMRLWDARLRVPFVNVGADSLQALGVIKGLAQHGWWWTNGNLGAPFGAQQYDFTSPVGDTANLLILKAFLIVSGGAPGFALNGYWLTTVVLCAATAHLVLRSLRLPTLCCVVGGVLFSLLPFHFIRGEFHAWISGYWGVPLGVWLVLGVLGYVTVWTPRREVTGWRRALSWSTARLLLVTFIVAGTLTYNAVFTIMLLVAAGALTAYRRRRLAALVPAVALCVLVLGWLGVMALPSLVYFAEHGANPVVGVRSTSEAELYGLKASQLLLPTDRDRLGPLRAIGREYRDNDPLPSEGASPYLGVVLGLAFVGGLVFLLLGTGTARGGQRAALVRDSSVLALVAFLIGTVGGGSAFISHLVSAQLRGYNRISVFIAFLSVIVLCVAGERLLVWTRGRWPASRARRRAATVGILAVGAFAAWQQTAVLATPDYRTLAAQWYAMGGLVGTLERVLPKDGMVLQLPYMPFPEHGRVNGMNDYAPLEPYVHSQDLRFSGGTMKGRPEDWMALTSRMTTTELVSSAAAAGFVAVWVDRDGYTDQGAAIEAELRGLTGVDPIVGGANGQIAVYPLASLAGRVRAVASPELVRRAGETLVSPVRVTWHGFDRVIEGATSSSRWSGARSSIRFATPPDGATPRTVIARMVLASPAQSVVTATLPDGRVRRLPAMPEGAPVTLRFRVTADRDTVTLASAAPDVAPPDHDHEQRFEVVDLSVVDPSAVALAARLASAGAER